MGPFFPTKPGEGVSGHPVGVAPCILQVLSALSQGDGGADHSHTAAARRPGHPCTLTPLCPAPPGGWAGPR